VTGAARAAPSHLMPCAATRIGRLGILADRDAPVRGITGRETRRTARPAGRPAAIDDDADDERRGRKQGMVHHSRTWLLGGLLMGLAAGAGAGAPLAAQECKINDGSPYQLGGAKQYLVQVASRGRDDEKVGHLQNATRLLTTNPEKMRKNEVGRQFLLARAYSSWLDNGNAEYVMRRGDLGMEENPDGTHNLLLAIDSAVRSVIAARPECEAEVDKYRAVHYSRVLNRAVGALNEGAADTAIFYARLSQQVNATDPRSWNVMSAAYGSKQQMDSSMMAMGQVIELAKDDTAFTEVVQQARYNLAVLTIDEAAGLEGSARDAMIDKAKGLLDDYLAISPDDPSAKQALGRLAAATGDTAAIANIFADMKNNPDNYTAIQLFEAGAAAASAGQDGDAITLIENGLVKNPNHRDALYNIANIYMSADEPEKMLATAMKLTEIAPNDPLHWQLVAGAWQVKRNTFEEDADRKAASDSIIAYIGKRDAVSPRVQIMVARNTGEKYEFVGSITNSGTDAASGTLIVEFLAADGTVVETIEQAFADLKSGGQAQVRLEVENADVEAYRYRIES
jgi:tetratricopeptide (TPR) repeat protein